MVARIFIANEIKSNKVQLMVPRHYIGALVLLVSSLAPSGVSSNSNAIIPSTNGKCRWLLPSKILLRLLKPKLLCIHAELCAHSPAQYFVYDVISRRTSIHHETSQRASGRSGVWGGNGNNFIRITVKSRQENLL